MAKCRCCCRGKPRTIPTTVRIWKLRVSDLGRIWWQDRNIFGSSGMDTNVELYGNIVYSGGYGDASATNECLGSGYQPIDDFPEVVPPMIIDASLTGGTPFGFTLTNDGQQFVVYTNAASPEVFRFSADNGEYISEHTLSVGEAIRAIYGVAGSADIIAASFVGGVEALRRYDNTLTLVGSARTYSDWALAQTVNSYLPEVTQFAVTDSTHHRLYNNSLTETASAARSGTEIIRAANSSFSVATDASNYYLLDSSFSQIWSSAFTGGFTRAQPSRGNYQSFQIDSSGNVFLLERNGANYRIRKLNAADGTEAWSTAYTVGAAGQMSHLLYDSTEDVCLVMNQPSGGASDALKSFDGSTGTAITSHSLGDTTGFNSTSSRGLIDGAGYLYVCCAQGDPDFS